MRVNCDPLFIERKDTQNGNFLNAELMITPNCHTQAAGFRIITYFCTQFFIMKPNNFPYPLLSQTELISQMDELAAAAIPYLFVVSYNTQYGYVIPQKDIDERFVRFSFHNQPAPVIVSPNSSWQPHPVSRDDYAQKFGVVMRHLQQGNSFLTNLTQPTFVETNFSIDDLYEKAHATYKLWLKDRFLVVSPESFIRISNKEISTYPMKGTIDASLDNAEQLLLNDEKEKAEHATIVDLLRNDLSMVADNVEVKRYRYVQKITTLQHDLLQVSSEINGQICPAYVNKPGSILFRLLPAGSICGAPKPKTLEIIAEAEGYDRGYYTGVCGFFDGNTLDSAVMIRFMEPAPGGLIFKSGGGITFRSDMENEYKELIQKVYVPVY